MHRRLALLPLIAAALVGLAACSSTAVGSPSAAPPASDTQAGSDQPSGSGGPADTTTLQPCDLANPDVLAQLNLTKDGPITRAGDRGCEYSRGADAHGRNGYSINVGLRDKQGIKDATTDGYSVTTVTVGSHQGRQLKATGGDPGCIVIVGVTSSSRMDVVVEGDNDSDQACQVGNQIARSVEPKLPAGSG